MLSRVLLVDATQMLYRSAFSQARILGMKDPVYGPNTVGSVVGFLRQAANRFSPLSIILVWDGGHSSRRKGILPTYKSGRPSITEDQSQRRWFDTGRLIQLLKKLCCRSILLPGKEADDIIGFLVGKCISPVIISADQDFLQLIKNGASCWFPDKDKYVSAVNFFEEYGVLPNQFLLYRAVVGDLGDAIPGVHGVGPKTILPLLERGPHIETFSALRQLMTGEKLSSREQTLFSSEEVVNRNIDLMDVLRETFLPEEIQTIDKVMEEELQFEDGCLNEMVPIGLNIAVEIWSEWSLPFRRLI